MKKKEHLPLTGVGPIYVAIIIACTVAGIAASRMEIFQGGRMGVLKIPFLILGILCIVGGLYLWVAANFQSRLGEHIKSNTLVTTGVYAWVRNPIYSAFMLMCTGALFIVNNLWLLVLPVAYWAFMTVLMRNTEEKWLKDLYGAEYVEYCRKVNRCIPWKR